MTETTPNGVTPYHTLDQLTSFIEHERQQVDYGKIAGNSRVVAIGDTHPVKSYKIEFIQALRDLRGMGFTHLGLEMSERSDYAQDLLDTYVSTGKRKEELREYLTRGFFGYLPEHYMRIIDTARQLGMRIVGIDMPMLQSNAILNDEERELQRNNTMAETVIRTLSENRSYKMITFTGNVHARNSEVKMGGILKGHGISTSTVRLAGAERKSDYTDDQAAKKAGLSQERYMISSESSFPENKHNPQYAYDWIIHMPEKERRKD